MASQRREVDKAPIIPPDAVAAALEQYCPDLGNWPQSWRIEEQDVPRGERVVESLKPFLINLLIQGLADKTLARHRDHMWLLGGEIIRRRHDDPDRAKMPVEGILAHVDAVALQLAHEPAVRAICFQFGSSGESMGGFPLSFWVWLG